MPAAGPVDRRHQGGRRQLPERARRERADATTSATARWSSGSRQKAPSSCRVPSRPCRIAATSTTTAPSQALRPRKRNDGGVSRAAAQVHRAAEAQALVVVLAEPAGPPRGLRRNRAECSTPPQRAHPAARAAAARSRSKASRSSWNLASASSVRYKAPVLLKLKTAMAKPGRNDPCSCGSGKKYKRCCLAKDQAAERTLAAAAAPLRRLPDVAGEIAARLAAAYGVDDTEDELTTAVQRRRRSHP